MYMGSSMCYVSMPKDSFKPRLAYVAPTLLQRGDEGRIVVGDIVTVKEVNRAGDDDDSSSSSSNNKKKSGISVRVLDRAPRKNLFCRASADLETMKLIAANLDQLMIITSFGNPAFSSRFLDRVLVAAAMCDIPSVIVVNKLDLEEDGLFQKIKETYEGAGYPVIGTCAKTGEGVDALRDMLGGGKISALYGLSGAGKSSLINRLGGLELVTREVSDSILGGRHTTSASNVGFLTSLPDLSLSPKNMNVLASRSSL